MQNYNIEDKLFVLKAIAKTNNSFKEQDDSDNYANKEIDIIDKSYELLIELKNINKKLEIIKKAS